MLATPLAQFKTFALGAIFPTKSLKVEPRKAFSVWIFISEELYSDVCVQNPEM